MQGYPVPTNIGFPVKTNVTVYQGGLCVLNAGYLAPATAAAGLIAVGRALKTVANASTDGAVSAEVESGCFLWANSAAADEIVAADLGQICYLVDDQTVAKTSLKGVRSVAGVVMKIETAGVWVLTLPPAGIVSDQRVVYERGITETVTSGAVSPSVPVTLISTTGTVAYTLADGIFKGQLKYLRCSVGASTPHGTITPATPTGFAALEFTAAEQSAVMRWNGAAWELALNAGGTKS
jgi:hypothetical protein